MENKRTVQKKTQKTRSDTAVQGTNDNSIVSKLSAVRQCYIEDDFLKYVVKKPCRRAPLINRGYYIRAKAMDHVLQSFLKHFSSSNQIVNMGAGFDMTYFRLCQQNLLQNTAYFEIDFPEVMHRKSDLIHCQPKLISLLNDVKRSPLPNTVLTSSKYNLLGVDLTDLTLLSTTLSAAGFNSCKPTLFVSEVVLCYMTPDSSSKLIEWAASTIKHGVFLTYEQIYPDDAFGRVMMKHFDVIGSQLKTIRHFPTISDQIHRYQCSGWFYVKAMDVNYFFHNYLTKQERSRIYHLEPFDEFEEWHLKCMHYMVLTAFSGECIGFAGNLWPREYLTRAGNTDVMVELESMTTVTESDNGQLSVTKTLGNDDGLSENSDATLRVVCGDIMDSKSAAEQEALDDDLPGDVYTWDSVFTDEELLTPLNKRFAHTASLILMPNKPSQPNHSTTDSDIKSKNLCRVTVASQGASVTSHISIPSSSSGLGEADSAAAGHGTAFSLSESADCYQLLAKQAYIMCVGGFGQQDDKHGRLSGLYFISLSTGKSVDVEYSGEACSFDCMYHSITNISESKLVMFGGRHSPAKPCNPASIWVLSCNVGQSEQQDKICCKCEVVQTMGATPCARWRHSAVEIKCQGRQYIFVYGGRTSDSMTLNDIHILDTDKWAWNKVEACGVLPQPTHSHTADVWRDSILITGGLSENEVAMDTIQQLKIPSSLDNKWIWSKLNVTGSFKPRYSHSSAVIGDHLFVVGGVSLCYPPPDITVINLLTSSIQSFNQPHRGAGPITMLHKHASVVVHQEDKAEMYIIGGGGNCFSFGTHFNQTPILFTIKNSKV